MAILSSKYDLYKVLPHSGTIDEFVKEKFVLLNGKMYRMQNGDFIIALEKGYKESLEIYDMVSNICQC